MQEIKQIINLIDKAIIQDPENIITWGNIIALGYDEVVDDFRRITKNSKNWLVKYQSELVTKTWITNLKIKYTWASGYFIEISKKQLSKIPSNFVHKQTLVNTSRFVTEKLLEFGGKLLEAENNLAEREYEIFLDVREKILNNFSEVKDLSKKTAFLDFISGLTNVAYQNNYTKPKITNDYKLYIKSGRHPVIEKNTWDFISNSLQLKKDDYIHIITWPNMWWKSTFLRQNALIILLAHIWSFVPVSKSIIPITDKIFSRIGASDNLYLGQSTFMVEMQEVANILNNSTKNSFVIIDEVGRWTSTYDWMSLAWAILKKNHDNIKAKTLFATHYHELIDKSKTLSKVSNYSVAVWENDENLVFLRKIIKGWIKKSFWLEVAKIAWLDNSVINEAKKMLKLLELEHFNTFVKQLTIWTSEVGEQIKEYKKKSEIEEELKDLNINLLTPIDALNKLREMKKKL